jgi:hypothetical protein
MSRIDREETMSQPSSSVLPSVADDITPLFGEAFAAITEADVVLDEAGWLALLIKIDREEGGA